MGPAAIIGMLLSSTLAAAVITIEIFGLATSFTAGLAAVIGFQITRHKTIYDYTVSHPGFHPETNV